VEQLVARKAHNLEVAGSSPAPASKKKILNYLKYMKKIFNNIEVIEREEERVKCSALFLFL
jgi:hypothetical protein